MKLAEVFPSKYLKAADLKGREPTVVIARCEIEQLGNENKLVTYFQNHEKGLVTNRTNADRIGYMYGQDTDDWIGKEITLYTDMVNFQGKTTEAIRVRPPAKRNGKTDPGYQVSSGPAATPVKQQKPTDDGMDQDIPF